MSLESILAIIVACLTILGTIIAAIVAIVKISNKVNKVVEQPYPCAVVKDLSEDVLKHRADLDKKLEKHDQYLSNDRLALEDIKSRLAVQEAISINTSETIKNIDRKMDQVMVILLRRGANLDDQ